MSDKEKTNLHHKNIELINCLSMSKYIKEKEAKIRHKNLLTFYLKFKKEKKILDIKMKKAYSIIYMQH